MRDQTIKSTIAIDPRWENLDTGSDAFRAFDQAFSQELTALVGRYLAFAHTQTFEAMGSVRGAIGSTQEKKNA